MKGLVLAGGTGTRLRPLTHTGAKQLVPVANKPILFYGLEHLAAAGITEVGMVVGATGPEIREAVGDGSAWGLEVTYIEQEAPRGLAHCVLIAGDFLGDDDVVVYLGDNLLRGGITELVHRFRVERDRPSAPAGPGPLSAQVLLARVPDPQRFGVAVLGPGGEVVGLVEKPEHPPSDLALVGVYLFDRAIHRAVRAIRPSARDELEITDAIGWLIDHGHRVGHAVLDGWWKDTGALAPLLEGNRLVLEALDGVVEGTVDGASRLEGPVRVEAGAVVERSVVRGPAVIGAGARIVDSRIGPFTAVGPGCEIVGSGVENTIVLRDSRVAGVPRLVDSLIGREVEVTRTATAPGATRLMLGDHSWLDLGPGAGAG